MRELMKLSSGRRSLRVECHLVCSIAKSGCDRVRRVIWKCAAKGSPEATAWIRPGNSRGQGRLVPPRRFLRFPVIVMPYAAIEPEIDAEIAKNRALRRDSPLSEVSVRSLL